VILETLLKLDDMPEEEIIELGKEEPRSDEKVLGSVPIRARKLRTIIARCTETYNAKVAELNESIGTREDFIAAGKILRPMKGMVDLLTEIFYQEMREEFGLNEDGPTTVICKGWVVVERPEEVHPQMPRFLFLQ
jgi:hypothetical protein